MRYHREKKFRASYFLIFTIFILILTFIIGDAQIRPLIDKVSTYQGKIIASTIISKAVTDALNSGDFAYDTLVKVTKNNNGYVSSIESNMLAINKLQAIITNEVNAQFKNISNETINLSTGTLSGFNFLYGKGPNITFKLEPVGYVESRLVSKFTSAGVNQTLHEIILEVDANISAVIPGFNTNVEIKSNYLIAETIVVGNIPESYTYITGDTRDDISKIMDSNILNNSKNTSLK